MLEESRSSGITWPNLPIGQMDGGTSWHLLNTHPVLGSELVILLVISFNPQNHFEIGGVLELLCNFLFA